MRDTLRLEKKMNAAHTMPGAKDATGSAWRSAD